MDTSLDPSPTEGRRCGLTHWHTCRLWCMQTLQQCSREAESWPISIPSWTNRPYISRKDVWTNYELQKAVQTSSCWEGFSHTSQLPSKWCKRGNGRELSERENAREFYKYELERDGWCQGGILSLIWPKFTLSPLTPVCRMRMIISRVGRKTYLRSEGLILD